MLALGEVKYHIIFSATNGQTLQNNPTLLPNVNPEDHSLPNLITDHLQMD